MISGVTKNGFAFEITDERVDNMELIDALADIDDGNLLAVSKVLTLLLGPEQKKKMYDFVRTEDGIVSAQTVSEMIVEILAAKKETKN
jgi:hypothetical protein|nr:MAG TPA: hypothetical protein [Bacteriophage sp.]